MYLRLAKERALLTRTSNDLVYNFFCSFILIIVNSYINRYLRLPIKEAGGLIFDSSNSRHRVFDRMGKPKTKADVINMLGDCSDPDHPVFRSGDVAKVKTIACGK